MLFFGTGGVLENSRGVLQGLTANPVVSWYTCEGGVLHPGPGHGSAGEKRGNPFSESDGKKKADKSGMDK